MLSAVHLSVCAVRNLDEKAEQDKNKYNKLNHCFFPQKAKEIKKLLEEEESHYLTT